MLKFFVCVFCCLTCFAASNFKPKVVYSKSSRFGLIEVIETHEPDVFNLCENGTYSIAHSFFKRFDYQYLGFEYEKLITLSICFSGKLDKIILLGLGAGELLGYLGSYFEHAVIESVDINPVMFDVVKDFRKINKKNMKFKCCDAFEYVKTCDKKFDLIVSDIYFFSDPTAEEYRGFFASINRMLAEDGVFAINAIIELPSKVVEDLYSNFQNVIPIDTGNSAVVFICYNGALKSPGQLKLVAESLQKKYQFRYNMADLLEKLLTSPSLNKQFWIARFRH